MLPSSRVCSGLMVGGIQLWMLMENLLPRALHFNLLNGAGCKHVSSQVSLWNVGRVAGCPLQTAVEPERCQHPREMLPSKWE